MEAAVLRLAHRAARDKRVTTHLGLVARAFGAGRMIVTGLKDEHLLDSIQRVVDSWGGPFAVEFADGWNPILKRFKEKGYTTVHLTMYGQPVQDEIEKIRKEDKVLVIVGGEKVPSELYRQVDCNIAVTSQPHSEISALAVFLDRLFEGRELGKEFKGAKKEVVPQPRGKRVLRK